MNLLAASTKVTSQTWVRAIRVFQVRRDYVQDVRNDGLRLFPQQSPSSPTPCQRVQYQYVLSILKPTVHVVCMTYHFRASR